MCPDCQRVIVSNENAENVLNPPQNPASSRLRYVTEITCLSWIIPKNTPIIKQARMFTVNVPAGNPEETDTFCIALLM